MNLHLLTNDLFQKHYKKYFQRNYFEALLEEHGRLMDLVTCLGKCLMQPRLAYAAKDAWAPNPPAGVTDVDHHPLS